MLFAVHTLSLLQAVRCQTSAQYPLLKYGKADKFVDLDFSGDEGFMSYLTSKLLFWETVTGSCLAVDLIPDSKVWERRGTLSLLWPLFQALCLGQFVETLTCALEGRQTMTETGMSIFEHSLAFAEAEGMLSYTLGLSPFGLPRGVVGDAKFTAESSDILTRNALFYKLNTPPEVLLLALISALNNLTSQVLGVFNLQNRFRLLNTGLWGLCFLGAFVWGFISMRPESGPDNMILRIPTVCIVGFIPHLLILLGTSICAAIYGLALTLTLLSPQADPAPSNFRERLRMARENLHANSHLSSIHFDMHEDFYTVLLKIGFSMLTVASEAVYLNEGQAVNAALMTWLEEERMKEIESLGHPGNPAHSMSIHLKKPSGEDRANGKDPEQWISGYARETTITATKSASRRHGFQADGVGHIQRGGRYIMAFEFFDGISRLVLGWLKLIANKLLDKAGIHRRPQWIRSTIQDPNGKKQLRQTGQGQDTPTPEIDFWLLSDEGVLSLPENDNVDVEQETRRRLLAATDTEREDVLDEDKLDGVLYDWWKHNGWWGEKDESGSYAPSQADDDTNLDLDDSTSFITTSTATSNVGSDDDIDSNHPTSSGRTTPTQTHPDRHQRSPSHPFTDHALTTSQLARLLDPSDPATRAEATMLAHHLTASKITTRSTYSSAVSSRASKLLTSTRLRPPGSAVPQPSSSSGPLSKEEEAQLLEEMILSRRERASATTNASFSPNQHHYTDSTASPSTFSTPPSDSLASGVPQCVVCQFSSRSVLVWPCRCLSLCEECRISLAMNNFGTCVCCRREVVGFSRLFVP